jgi:hypothetical protein
MTQEAGPDDRRLKRRRLVPFWVGLLFGIMGLLHVFSQPRIATYYRPDILLLIAVGLCFGLALAALISFFEGPRTK